MDTKLIKELLKLFSTSQLNKLEIKEGEFHINMERSMDGVFINPPKLTTHTSDIILNGNLESSEKIIDFNDAKEIISPMVGIFYSAPSPESAPYIKKGDIVKKGDVLCLIEAMKVMSEITSDFDGEVVDICVSDGQLVEYSQIMFKIV